MTQQEQMICDAVKNIKLVARLGDEIASVFELVSIDGDDRRAYIKTWEGSEVFCVPFENIELAGES